MTKSNWYFKNSGFQHTAARRRLEVVNNMGFLTFLFQHTAARRRLDVSREVKVFLGGFQHTAARRRLAISRTIVRLQTHGFNTQPPEGGWRRLWRMLHGDSVFQHTAARRRLVRLITVAI